MDRAVFQAAAAYRGLVGRKKATLVVELGYNCAVQLGKGNVLIVVNYGFEKGELIEAEEAYHNEIFQKDTAPGNAGAGACGGCGAKSDQ